MKGKFIMTINYASNTIELTQKESKAAGKVGTEAFKEMLSLMQQFPNYKIQVIARATTKKSCDYKGLTYDNMKKYIQAHDDEQKTIMAEFEMLRGESNEAKNALAESCSYQEIKEWFLNKFPAIKQFHEMRSKMLTAAAN